MSEPTRQKARLPRRWFFVAGSIALAAALFVIFGPEKKSKSVDRRVQRLLNAQRRQELRSSVPFWIQRVYWAVARRFPQDSDQDIHAELLALGPKAIPALSKALLKDPSPAVRSVAANILGQLGELEAFPALTNSLSVDFNERVVPEVAEALVELGDSNAVPAMVSALPLQTNDYVRANLLQHLGNFHDDTLAIQTLTAALTHETNDALRTVAARALGEGGARSAWTNLVEALCTDPVADVRSTAASALGSLNMPESVPILLSQMRTNLTPDVRQAAVSALPVADNPEVLAALRAAITTEKAEPVREAVVYKLGAMTNPGARIALMLAATNDSSASISRDAINELAGSISLQPFTELLRIVREEPIEELREAAAFALAETGRPEAVAALTNYLQNSRSPPLRVNVAQAMTVRGMREVFPFLVERLKMDARARVETVAALGLLGDPKAIGPLITALTNDPAPDVRCSAAAALGNLRAGGAVPFLINLVQTETNRPLRSACIGALGTIQDRRAVAALTQCAVRKRDAAVRYEACNALGEIGEPAAVRVLADIASHERVQRVRFAAVQALGQIGGAEAVASLLSNLSRWGRSAPEQVWILKALGGSADLAASAALIRMVENDDQRVVLAAAEALGDLGATNAVPALLQLATAGSREVRAQAAKALGEIGDSQALPTLCDMLKRDRNPKARTKAAEALAIISNSNAVPALQNALADPDDEVRTEVICSLGHLGDTNCAGSVIALLKDKQRASNIRFDACYYLVEMGGPAGMEALTEILQDNNSDATLAACCALAALGKTNAIENLRGFINHATPFCRLAAIVCLARNNSPEATELLNHKAADTSDPVAGFATTALSDNLTAVFVDALASTDIRIRRAAVFLLLFFNEPAAIPALRKACHDRDPEIRDSARWAGRRLERQDINP